MKNLPRIIIESVKHKRQRYNTHGDYFKKGKVWVFRISRLGNLDREFSIAMHELVEWYLTQKKGIKEKDITRFDMANLKNKDPGSLPEAPYHNEHMFALKIEKALMRRFFEERWDGL